LGVFFFVYGDLERMMNLFSGEFFSIISALRDRFLSLGKIHFSMFS